MSSSVTALSLYMGSRGFLLEPIPAVCGLIAGPSPMAAAHQEQFGGSVLCSRHFEPATFRSLTILIYKMINNDVKEFVRELTAIRTDCCKKNTVNKYAAALMLISSPTKTNRTKQDSFIYLLVQKSVKRRVSEKVTRGSRWMIRSLFQTAAVKVQSGQRACCYTGTRQLQPRRV